MEWTDDCKTKDTISLKHPQLVYLKRKLEDLEEVHRDGKRTHLSEVERLKADYERIRKANKEQAEQIARLKKHDQLTESRTQELKKNVSTAQSEARELRLKLRGVEAERDRFAGKQTDSAETRRAIADVETRKKYEIQEREKRVAELQRALTAEKQRAVEFEAKVRDQRAKLEKEARETRVKNTFIEQRLERAQEKLKEVESRNSALERKASSTSESLVTRVSELEATLKLTAEQYSRLASSSTSLTAYEALKLEAASLRLCVARLERKLGNSDEQVYELAHLNRQTQATNIFLSEQLQEAHAELKWRFEESKVMPSLSLSPSTDGSLRSDVDEFLIEQRHDMDEEQVLLQRVSRNQLSLSRENTTQLIEYLSSTERSLSNERAEVTRLKGKLAETDVVITKVSQEGESRKRERDDLQNKVTSHTTEIFNLQTKLAGSEKALLAAESRARTELAKREDLLRKERELTSRLHSTVRKSQMAEDALKAEIEQLSTELAGADAYREAYQSIAEEMRGLVARNALAEDEANRLSQFNAEILSHRNPTQKILYVDRIRRELADTKQKLTLSTRDHETAMSEAASLRDELAMYKSVTVPFEGKPRTTMTRIRRMPLGAQTRNVQAEVLQEEDYRTYSDQHNLLGDMTIDELS